MSRITVKSSTVFVSVDHETRVFRSVDEVPPEWRKRFERPKGGLKPQTILIADRKGREEIMRSLQGRPSSVQTRWKSSGGATSPVAATVSTAAPAEDSGRPRHWAPRQIVLEAGFVGTLAGLLYFAFFR